MAFSYSFGRTAGFAASLITALTLMACGGGKDAAKPADQAPAAAAPTAAKEIKAGFIYVGPVGDGGWTFAHDNGRKAMVEA